jgi:tetratricopeptide (TPR) repeat protein
VTGAGYLNSFKIGSIAFKLVNLCNQFREKEKRDQCMLKSLESDELFDFSKSIKEDKIIRDIQSAFPQCAEGSTTQNQAVSCDTKKMAINELRKAAFLMPENLNFWKKISCVHSVEGLSANAEYYSRLGRGRRILEKDLAMIPYGINADFVEVMRNSEFSKEFKEFAVAAVKENGRALKYASEALKSDRDVVLSAFKVNEGALEYASETLKNDKEFVLGAIKVNDVALEYASEALKNDKDFVLAAIKESVAAFLHASKNLKNDKEVVLSAVKKSGYVLEYASDALKNDREVVLAAVKQTGYALEYASDSLKNDPEIRAAAGKKSQ